MAFSSRAINAAGALMGTCAVFAATQDKWKLKASSDHSKDNQFDKLPTLPMHNVLINAVNASKAMTKAESSIPSLEEAIEQSKALCERVMVENGLPGLVIGVTVNGKQVWSQGFGYSDLENQVKMESNAVIRIASISKSLTMAMLAKLIEDGKVDIECPIQKYVSSFPEKSVNGKKVVITTRHLLSHLSGIRHYKKKEENDKDKAKEKDNNGESEMNLKEYYLKDKFKSVEDSMKLFKDDELFHEPGTKYHYSSHAWTVVSAIVEKVAEKPFPDHAKRMFAYWGLKNTFLDEHEPIIYNRSRYYTKHKKNGKLQNSPYVDNSYKWSGGGFLSTVEDLTQFANMLLYCYQYRPVSENERVTMERQGTYLPARPYLKHETVEKMWTGDPRTKEGRAPDLLYGLGFVVGEPMRNCMFCKERDLMVVQHTGGAIGASSVLLLAFPKHWNVCRDEVDYSNSSSERTDVKGISVAMITNLTDVGLSRTAQDIAGFFQPFL